MELGPVAPGPPGRRTVCRPPGVPYVITVGELAGEMAAGARAGGLKPMPAGIAGGVPGPVGLALGEGWHILVKGSRGMKMEQLVSSLLELKS